MSLPQEGDCWDAQHINPWSITALDMGCFFQEQKVVCRQPGFPQLQGQEQIQDALAAPGEVWDGRSTPDRRGDESDQGGIAPLPTDQRDVSLEMQGNEQTKGLRITKSFSARSEGIGDRSGPLNVYNALVDRLPGRALLSPSSHHVPTANHGPRAEAMSSAASAC